MKKPSPKAQLALVALIGAALGEKAARIASELIAILF